jgi:hypothetical protein
VDIDEICETLDCIPGEAPGIVAEMAQQLRKHSPDEPPQRDGRYLVEIDGWGWDIKYWMLDRWQVHDAAKVLAWQELPAALRYEIEA